MKEQFTSCPTRTTDLFSSSFSREVNQAFGVKNCDSVSLTTGKGLRKATGMNVSDAEILDIVHVGMAASAFAFATGSKGLGLGIAAILGISYLNGR